MKNAENLPVFICIEYIASNTDRQKTGANVSHHSFLV